MAVNKPVGDNARKGAVKKRTQLNEARRRHRMDQAQQNIGRVHGGKKARSEEKDRQKVQGCSPGKIAACRMGPVI
jgi:hypothetical protein